MRGPTYYFIGIPTKGILSFEGKEQDGQVTEIMFDAAPNPNNNPLLNPLKGTLGKDVFRTLKEARPAYSVTLTKVRQKLETKLSEMDEDDPGRADIELALTNLAYLAAIATQHNLPVTDAKTLRYRTVHKERPRRRSLKPSSRAVYAKLSNGKRIRWRVELDGQHIYLTAMNDVIVSASAAAKKAIGQYIGRKLRRYERLGAKLIEVS